jgi:phage minor structural protein
MRRLMVYDRTDKPLGDIAEADVFSLVRRATINGEHALEVTTTRKLGKGQRILMQDGRQIWHEYVVDGVDELHGAGRRPVGTYTCVWSIQHDLQGVRVSVMPGVQTPVTAGEALARLLGTTRRWTVGTVTNTSTGGASMYDTDAWSALSTLVKTWGGEVDTTVEVDQAGVVSRKVDLFAQQGDQEAKRRFDFGADIKSVRRTMPDGPLYCRMTPRGKGEETEGGGYGRKVTIESVNDGKNYLELASMVPLAKLPDGTGGWEYPTIEVENGDCETPAELLAWARDVVEDTLAPKVGYDVDVLQAAREGIDLQGVSLGDAVQVVDRSFGDEGIRISARVVEMTVDELEDRDISIKLGHISDGVTNSLGSLAAEISQVRDTVVNINGGTLSTADYLDRLISRLNNEINASGGYTYITQGQGIRTYDQAVSDPLIGAEATKVVEIKGGSIRIANSKTAQGEWEWKSVFTSGHIAAELVTAANITAGYIGSADSGNYWNLDTGEFRMAANAVAVGNQTLAQYIGDNLGLTQSEVFNLLTNNGALQGLYMSNGNLYINGTYMKIGKVSSANGRVYFDLDNNELACDRLVSTASGSKTVVTVESVPAYKSGSDYGLKIVNSGYANGVVSITPATRSGYWYESMIRSPEGLVLKAGDWTENATSSGTVSRGFSSLDLRSGNGVILNSSSGICLDTPTNDLIQLSTQHVYVYCRNGGGFDVMVGTKSKVVETDNYSQRRLYCYETPSPMFADVGSGVIGEDGYCYVEIDDIFSETVNTSRAYQVFLQRCGEGELWVSEKNNNYFVVQGTPGLSFDWEMKARQSGFEHLRLEPTDLDESQIRSSDELPNPEDMYQDYIKEIEQALCA